MTEPNWENRTLFHGDNLDFLRAMNSESVDLIATDPPFNKGRDFHATPDSLASGAKFQDRWSWEQDVHQEWVDQITDDYPRLMEAIESARYAHSDGMGAFMCFMAVRLLAMRRILKPTGSIYLHCDPTASHYLKAVMDSIFGWRNFVNEIVWHYQSGGRSRNHFPKKHDSLLFYAKDNRKRAFNTEAVSVPRNRCASCGNELSKWNNLKRHVDADGRVYRSIKSAGKMYRYYDDEPVLPPNVWLEFSHLQQKDPERTGYPTQKPLALYERIIKASSNEGDIVLDPFCGCATTLVAAERLKRQWVGIDIWDEAHETVIRRLQREGLEGPDGSLGEALPLYGKIHYSKEPPERTDEGETATVALETINRKELAAWQKLSHKEMVAVLKEAQADADDAKLVVCAGCGRKLEPEFMELDHITPKSELHSTNDLSNRILLCRPCNGRKSNRLSMSGLWKENKSKTVQWMVDEMLAENAVRMAYNAYLKEQRKDG